MTARGAALVLCCAPGAGLLAFMALAYAGLPVLPSAIFGAVAGLVLSVRTARSPRARG